MQTSDQNAVLDRGISALADRMRDRSPVFMADADTANQRVVLAALEAQGFRCCLSDGNMAAINRDEQPLVLVDGAVTRQMDSWLAYANQGGTLVLINPDYSVASKLGLKEYQGVVSRAVFCFKPLQAKSEVAIELFGSISIYRSVSGHLHGYFKMNENYATCPGIVEMPWGDGKIFIVLFCLGNYITYMHQRDRAAADSTARGSAEHILLSRIDRDYLSRPQLDILLGLLASIISKELVRVNRPVPRFASLPEGKKNLVVFSFDDACPSGRPVREAWNSYHQFIRSENKGVYQEGKKQSFISRFAAFLNELVKYPVNYEDDLRVMVDLFSKYEARGSVYILPFLGPIKNRPQLTGYRWFSRKAYKLLKNTGWDIGTHIKPVVLGDYAAVQKSFRYRFGATPKGHRGHELGWVAWDEDWGELDQLEYLYDTTWNWGGYAGLTWILGTSYPFHPINQSGYPFSVLEVPVVAWLDDLHRVPQVSMKAIEDALSDYPGIYHFAGHTWLIRKPEYRVFVETILTSVRKRKDVVLGWSLSELCNFWQSRATSTVELAEWEQKNGILSFTVNNYCQDGELAIDVPYRWGSRRIAEVTVENVQSEFTLREYFDVEYAMFKLKQKSHRIKILYR